MKVRRRSTASGRVPRRPGEELATDEGDQAASSRQSSGYRDSELAYRADPAAISWPTRVDAEEVRKRPDQDEERQDQDCAHPSHLPTYFNDVAAVGLPRIVEVDEPRWIASPNFCS